MSKPEYTLVPRGVNDFLPQKIRERMVIRENASKKKSKWSKSQTLRQNVLKLRLST